MWDAGFGLQLSGFGETTTQEPWLSVIVGTASTGKFTDRAMKHR
jgi:hypothetical protein